MSSDLQGLVRCLNAALEHCPPATRELVSAQANGHIQALAKPPEPVEKAGPELPRKG